MFVINTCRRNLNDKRTFFNYFDKTLVAVGKKKKSDDASNNNSENNEKNEKKTNNKSKINKSKLYIVPQDETNKIKATKKIQDILNIAGTKLSSELTKIGDKTNVEIPSPPDRMGKKIKRKKASDFSNTLEKKILESAENLAEKMGGDVEQTKKDLLKNLESFSIEKVQSRRSFNDPVNKKIPEDEYKLNSLKIQSIVSDINLIEKKKQNMFSDYNSFLESNDTVMNLDIFDGNEEWEENTKLLIWDELEKEELKFLVTHPPRNYYEEMIQWTEEGKLWHFPIDNEQGMDEEAKVHFSEHVFLEDKLEPWCPKSGPLRHFMELVCVGLSKNPYLSVPEKHEHIYWFRDYFKEKKKILTDFGAIPVEEQEETSSLKKNLA